MTPLELKNFISENDESEILDYKENLEKPTEIGEYISALGNSAIMIGKPAAYIVWGVKDFSKEIVGTDFDPYKSKTKAGDNKGMPLITSLEVFLDPTMDLKWEKLDIENKRLILLTIDVRHLAKPISYRGERYIRVGTSKKNLKGFPEKERRIWQAFESSKFELKPAITGITFPEVSSLLDLEYYIDARSLSQNITTDDLIIDLLHNSVIKRAGESLFSITNMGAYTLAKDISKFPNVERRTMRIVQYKGKSNTNASFDKKGNMGIARSFNNIIEQIMRLIPYTENYANGIRKDIPLFPKLAIRELVANALVHQDFTLSGSRPLVELYENRIEISNPGTPLIDPNRFLDFKPKSRNDELANLLGNLNIVESRGTGIDKVVTELENLELPAMEINVQGAESTVVILRGEKNFKDMSSHEKIQSIYWHACLKYVSDEQITNATLRSRFGMAPSGSAQISKAIVLAIDSGLIKPYDPSAGKKYVKYIPFWGKSVNEFRSN
ncbi:putative DNA binding domain-containing protein [Ligilactobacillus murinus]|nr:putative DNA binding domain-containing protein [Ligilactobacillus murinus]